ncbi:ATP-dependent helicase HrpB [Gorillibacterium massiliense]|uniref:ATP-dependent helicase HrpB n=1 Tax=Gorillibacterium massiliense TaxID=1280390 RepID=UPI0012DCD62D|nr:ATP-dependent helicase HrpB [Gorillibacterium massiliense]
MRKPLPVDTALPALLETLRHSVNAVLTAPPGAGKTTRVPLALIDESWVQNRRILMLEPRRIAARSAAHYMAKMLGEEAGETVGYRVRMDAKVSPRTRIEVITEGVYLRMLQEDPTLEGVGAVLFDEFHERSLNADLGLALTLESRALFQSDLRIVLMSATLEADKAAEVLGDAPIIRSEGRAYPVDIHYLDKKPVVRIEDTIVKATQQAIREEEGDLLVFLPGAGEIRRVEAKLRAHYCSPSNSAAVVRIAPLYGDLSLKEQDEALIPSPEGRRKIVLATSIAETSLTVEGVRVVIDSGLMRIPRFSPRTGLTRLTTVPVSKASAEQRRGRAGRLMPGVCYRLWTEAEHWQLPEQTSPEMMDADLAPLALQLAAWGAPDPGQLIWLDPPPAGSYAQALGLLTALGVLDQTGGLTEHGRKMAGLSLHPRLAHMILQAIPLGLGDAACDLAALLTERDLFRGKPEAADVDLRLRLDVLRRHPGSRSADPFSATLRLLRAEADRWKLELGIGGQKQANLEDTDCGLLLALAYPDRIAQERSGGRYLMSGGRGAYLEDGQPLYGEKYIVAADLDDRGADSRIFLAAPVTTADIERLFADQIKEETLVYWERDARGVRARKRVTLGALIMKDNPVSAWSSETAAEAWREGLRLEGLGLLPWTKESEGIRRRILFMGGLEQGWPDVSDEGLLNTLDEWLLPHLAGMKSAEELKKLKLVSLMQDMLSWEQRMKLDKEAPTHFTVPSGSRIPIDYSDSGQPHFAVRLQEMFGLHDTPRIGFGRVPLTVHLLSPAQRPVQVTQDLAGFWARTYFDVKKDLKGRYPKHYWPEDPTQAVPTSRVRPRPDNQPPR